jgi:hypothetical protein
LIIQILPPLEESEADSHFILNLNRFQNA